MNPTRIRSVLAIGAALALALLPLGSGPAAQGKGTIKIATQSPLSGGAIPIFFFQDRGKLLHWLIIT